MSAFIADGSVTTAYGFTDLDYDSGNMGSRISCSPDSDDYCFIRGGSNSTNGDLCK
jgi:hypothetical protein